MLRSRANASLHDDTWKKITNKFPQFLYQILELQIMRWLGFCVHESESSILLLFLIQKITTRPSNEIQMSWRGWKIRRFYFAPLFKLMFADLMTHKQFRFNLREHIWCFADTLISVKRLTFHSKRFLRLVDLKMTTQIYFCNQFWETYGNLSWPKGKLIKMELKFIWPSKEIIYSFIAHFKIPAFYFY